MGIIILRSIQVCVNINTVKNLLVKFAEDS